MKDRLVRHFDRIRSFGRVGRSALAGSLVVLVAGLLAAALPAPAAAQPGPIESPVKVEFTFSGGVLAPASTLVDGSGVTGGELELSEAFAVGGGIGVLLPGGFSVEGQALFSPGTDLEPSGGGDAVTDADFLAATANIVYRLPTPLLQPYFGAGGGLKRVSFDDPTVLGTDSETDFTGSLLLGTYVKLIPGWTIRVEARDYLSSFTDPRTDESEFQNDLAFLAGVSYRFP